MVRTRSLRLALVIVLSSFMFALPALAAPQRAGMDSILQRLAQGKGVGLDNHGQRVKIERAELRHYARSFVIDAESERPTAGVRLQLDAGARARLESMGIKTYGNLRGFASAVIPIDRLAEVSEVIGVERMQLRAIPQLELNVSVPAIGADVAWNDYNARGQDTILGIVDSGTDVTHEDFIKPDGTTRFHMVWYQDDRCIGTPPPAPYDFGCLFTEGDINDHIDGIATIDFPDSDGHGTHVMGTAAGDGSATGLGQPAFQYVGPANEAGLITVKVFPEPGLPGSCTTCFETSLAIEFIADMAASLGMPYAINLSLGSSFGSHDGFDVDELTIDSVTGPGIPGGVVVKSAGNNRGIGLHESGTVAQGATNSHTFTVPTYTANPGTFNDIHAFSLWYQGGDSLTVTISDPTTGCPGANSFTCSTGDDFGGVSTSSGAIICDAPGGLAANGDHVMELELDDQIGPTPCRGVWTVQVTGDTITQGGHYDFYAWYSVLGTAGLSADWDTPDPSQVISIPGTANHTTTVGAYKTKQTWTNIDGDPFQWVDAGLVNDIASFSSPGPTRDGRLKPEITAPGMGIVSALSGDVPASEVGVGGASRPLVQQDGVHWILLGTSFSAPHVTGAFAQMLGVNPNLDAVQLRTLLTSTASTDAFTEAGAPTPNNDWGYGKVDVPAAFEALIKRIPDLTMAMDATGGMWTGISTATTYNVYRADVAALDGTFFGTCLHSGLPTPDFPDIASPALGAAFAYHVTGVKDGIEGLIRINPDGTGVLPSNPCP
ncbi:MAG TPA: S8 family serine peptidase [Candidatus Polarisedimenticolia bacterium]|nr:S8 family serine peptidase [Candidatus Polarisedimenticolia bacterium]